MPPSWHDARAFDVNSGLVGEVALPALTQLATLAARLEQEDGECIRVGQIQ
jgi:hypothetical protein